MTVEAVSVIPSERLEPQTFQLKVSYFMTWVICWFLPLKFLFWTTELQSRSVPLIGLDPPTLGLKVCSLTHWATCGLLSDVYWLLCVFFCGTGLQNANTPSVSLEPPSWGFQEGSLHPKLPTDHWNTSSDQISFAFPPFDFQMDVAHHVIWPPTVGLSQWSQPLS